MVFKARREALILFMGDCLVLTASLWSALALRSLEIPSGELLLLHISPFSIIGLVWLFVFFIFDLYAKQTVIAKRRLPQLIIRAQALNLFLSIIFFYFIPYFIVTPKTILFLDISFVTILMYIWRRVIVEAVPRGRVESAVILSDKPEGEELTRELETNSKYGIRILPASILETGNAQKLSFVILDLSNTSYDDAFKNFYSLLVAGVRFVDISEFYEDIFDRVPLSYVDEQWFLKHISNRPKELYDVIKRLLDIAIAVPLAVATLILFPFISLFIFMFDGSPITILQERVGWRGHTFVMYKFRTMEQNDVALNAERSRNRVTRFGALLRKLRVDELLQLWSVLKGDLSLIGPRPELPSGVELYVREIPFYNARLLIKPGLSGWAQLYHDNHPHHAAAVDATREKLSYDLYYIKNRSIWLDIKIALKTIKTLFLTAGI